MLAALRAGTVAGLAGGVLLDAYLVAVNAFARNIEPASDFEFVASALIGKAGYSLPGTVALGAVTSLVVAAGWGAGYAWVATRTPAVLARPYLAGTVYGVVVAIAMQIVEVAAGIWVPIAPGPAFTLLVANTLFFGIPVALITSALLRPLT